MCLATSSTHSSHCANEAFAANGKMIKRTRVILWTSEIVAEWVLVPRLAHSILLARSCYRLESYSWVLNVFIAYVIKFGLRLMSV